MKILICLALIFVLVVSQSNLLQKSQKEKDFVDFQKKYQKKYDSEEEKAYRFSVYKDNLKRIAKLQEDNPEATFGVNQLTDLTSEEFLSIYATAKPEKKPVQKINVEQNLATDIPSSLDLRNSPGMPPVRDIDFFNKSNKSSCGSCWTFSVTASTESRYWRNSRQSVTFSAQELIDCLPQSDDTSGSITQIFDYIQSQGGLSLDSDYPYTGVTGECKEKKKLVPLNITLFSVPGDVNSLKNALNQYGVLIIGVDATDMQSYQGGIYSRRGKSESKSINHYVNLVGYDTDHSGRKYWIVRNSWNSWWGEKGYARLDARIDTNGNSLSGLSYENVYYPVLSDNPL